MVCLVGLQEYCAKTESCLYVLVWEKGFWSPARGIYHYILHDFTKSVKSTMLLCVIDVMKWPNIMIYGMGTEGEPHKHCHSALGFSNQGGNLNSILN